MRSSPNSSGHGLSEATHSVALACLVADRIQLTTVALELLALGFDDLGGSLRGEALVGEHALGSGDLRAEPLPLGFDVAVRLDPLGLDDGFEDPQVVAVELCAHAAAAKDRGSLLNTV